MRRRLLAGPAAALLLTATLLLTSCAPASSGSGTSELVVFAASSLNPAFATLGKDFEAAHPGVTVKFSFDGSAALVDQLKAGAPADVFASADTSNMDKASTAGLIGGSPAQFTTNVLTLITPKGNPAGITGLDRSLDGKKLVICADGVPCGTATKKLAAALGLTLKPVSEETKVTDVRTKVESGQADAGIVYVTDARASDEGGDAADHRCGQGTQRVPDRDRQRLRPGPARSGVRRPGHRGARPAGAQGRRFRRMIRPPLPRWLLLPVTAAVVFLAVPLVALLARVPWTRLPALLSAPAAVDAFWLSLRTCAVTTLVSLVLGLPLALLLSRGKGRWAAAGRTLSTVPMVLPPVVAGLALLIALGRREPLGGWLAASGIDLAFTTTAVVIAQTFVAMPYLVVSVEGALRSTPDDYAIAAATLGASPTTVLRRVSLPLVAPAVASGAALAFARALGEFGATLTFAGSLQGTTRTLPLEIYLQREVDTDTALALSVVLITIAAVLVAVTARFSRGAWSQP